MKLSNKQKAALEKISGEPWDSFHPDAAETYFAFTDRGEKTPLFERVWKTQLPNNEFNEIEQSLWDLMQDHTFHPVIIELWKVDFLSSDRFPPLLFLWDFFGPQIDYEKWREQGYSDDKPTFIYPDAYVKHAFEVYKEVRGYIPIDEVSGIKEEADRLGVAI